MKLPWTCERCGTSHYHYGGCQATPECAAICKQVGSMVKLLRLAREINPALPPDKELEGKVVTISMSKDWIGATVQPSSDKRG